MLNSSDKNNGNKTSFNIFRFRYLLIGSDLSHCRLKGLKVQIIQKLYFYMGFNFNLLILIVELETPKSELCATNML